MTYYVIWWSYKISIKMSSTSSQFYYALHNGSEDKDILHVFWWRARFVNSFWQNWHFFFFPWWTFSQCTFKLVLLANLVSQPATLHDSLTTWDCLCIGKLFFKTVKWQIGHIFTDFEWVLWWSDICFFELKFFPQAEHKIFLQKIRIWLKGLSHEN